MNIAEENEKLITYYGSDITAGVRNENLTPFAYRLMEKLDGRLVLQGAYKRWEGRNSDYKWCDIETVKEVKESSHDHH